MYTKIISAFPACGKSYIYEHQVRLGLKVSDSDSSNFSWVETEVGKTRNPDFPSNYIKHIKSLIGEVDYIFISSHDEVKLALEEEELPYILVMPDPSLKSEWIGRCWLRGSPQSFIKVINDNWEDWVNPQKICFAWNPVGVVYLKSNEHLSDKLSWFETFSGYDKGTNNASTK